MVIPNEEEKQDSNPKPPEQTTHHFKFVMVGDANVGKSALVNRFTKDVFTVELKVTIGVDFAVKNVTSTQGHPVKLQIWDTAGEEKFRDISVAYYRGAHGMLVVYDVTSRQSYEHMRHWLHQVSEHSTEAGTAISIVGNKTDLKEEKGEYYGVDSLKNWDELSGLNIAGFFEVSAKTKEGVEEVFMSTVDYILAQKLGEENPMRKAAQAQRIPQKREGLKSEKSDAAPKKAVSDSSNSKAGSSTKNERVREREQKSAQKPKSKLCAIL